MKKQTSKILYTVLLAFAGAVFISGLTPSKMGDTISWHRPFAVKSKIIAASAQLIPAVKDAQLNTESDISGAAKGQEARIIVNGRAIIIPVLMYHHVGNLTSEERAKDAIASDLTVSPADFESQVQYFHDLDFHSVSVNDLYQALVYGKQLPSRPIIFTFDDGYDDVFVNAVPILKKYGYAGSFAIATELLGRPTYAQWSDVIEAHNQGMEILSHTENHLDLTSKIYSDTDLRREIFDSKRILEQKLGSAVDFFVYPYGHHNPHIEDLVNQAGYKMAFTTEYGTQISEGSFLAEPRVRVHGEDGLAKLEKVIVGIERTDGQILNNP